MKKTYLFFSVLLASTIHVNAQRFDDYFEDRTLKSLTTFAGNRRHRELYVDELVSLPHWYGRRQRLDEVPLKEQQRNYCALEGRRKGDLSAYVLESVPGGFRRKNRSGR